MKQIALMGLMAVVLAVGFCRCGGGADTRSDGGPGSDTGGSGTEDTGNTGGDEHQPDGGTGDVGLPDGGHDAGHDAGQDGGSRDGGLDAATTGAPLSTLTCELSERPGPIPQPPQAYVTDFGQPVRLPASLNDACPNDAVEVSPDGKRIYYSYSINKLDLLVEEKRAAQGTEVRFQDLHEDGTWGPPRLFDLRKDDPDALPGETRVSNDGRWVIWHALSAKDYGYVRGLPAGQTFDLDLFEASVENDVPGPGTHIGPEVNSEYLEGEHWATDDGRTIYFTSNRPGGFGDISTTDIWVVTRDAAGRWGTPTVLPEPVNSSRNELQPALSPDGVWFYFVSDRSGPAGIWRIRTDPGGTFTGAPEIVIGPYSGEPSFATDGRLFFVHVEIDFTVSPADVYDADIYYVDPR
ncbi:MAG: PD40 domain-containing protein [Deltaproteobacteria bacterium]|nr:PD40 domain-containing protein [Deltaproteobacteria bacterium]